MPEFSACAVCGSTQYSLDNGMYFCDTCGTALNDVSQLVDANDYTNQEIEEEVEAVVPGSASIGVNKRQVTAHQKYFYEYTSWEIYNYALKGWVDELIQMGIDPQLKVVALQVWAKILSLSKVAFFSEDKTEKPRLGIHTNKLDAHILYGVKNIKRDLFGITNKSQLLRAGGKLKEGKERNKRSKNRTQVLRKDLMKLHQKEQESAALEASQMSQTLDNLMADDLEKRKNTVLLNPKAKKALDEAIKNGTPVDTKIKDEIFPFNLTTLIAVLRCALVIMDTEVLTSDLFRLAENKFLSLFHIANLVPEHILAKCDPMLYSPSTHLTMPRPDSVDTEVAALLRYMNVTYRPNLGQLCARYCQELQLPVMVVEWTQLIIKLYPVSEIVPLKRNTLHYKYRYDVIVMACIIFVMKLFFSLDDVTEYEQSKVAAAINKKIRKHKLDEPILFEWNEWRKYITCRKTLIALHHYPTFLRLHQDKMFDANLLLRYWQKQVLPPGVRRSAMVDFYSSLLKDLDPSLELNTDKKLVLPDLNLQPSLTPFSSLSEELLSHHSNTISPAVLTLLKQNFPETSVKFLAEETYLQKLAEKLGIQVSVSDEMNKLLSIKKIEEVQRMDRFPTQGVYGLPAVSCKFAPFFVSGKSKKKLATPALSQTSNLPPEAMQLLKNRLDSCQAQKEAAVTSTARKRRKNGEINAAGDCSKSSKSFELNKTMTNYWILHINPWKTTSSEVAEFDVHLTKLFPNSFVWLLRECCFLLDCKITDLYREICDVEDLLLGKDLP
ncbi:unnamed protein product [Bemisia tabaci]|uniref:TATA box-binding protein-associated factor RNA polymerase I subunit B n=1 Tax=Bemisia tabaci TaxID=7038 RepID=A0A9P0ADS5_BEMTA|nr:unnamed protein product [Bemisia tabaci]